MKWGLLGARAEDRGLGVLTWEVYRNLSPDRTLAVDMGEWARGFAPNPERYPDATWVTFDGTNPAGPLAAEMAKVGEWLDGLDVVYMAETAYDWRIVDLCKRMGIATVLHTMPEFHRPECDQVDHVWLPTPWRAEYHPDALVMPVPVALDRFGAGNMAARAVDHDELRVLHSAGHRAHMDRNGTLIVAEAMRYVTRPVHLTIRTQDRSAPHPAGYGPNVTVDVIEHGAGDYWEQYVGQHVLVMPRRYGGLCLPVQEAMAAGCAVIMSDTDPNGWWPTLRVGGGRGAEFMAPAGGISSFNTDPRRLAAEIDAWAGNRLELGDWQRRAELWALDHSWANMAERWYAALDAMVPA